MKSLAGKFRQKVREKAAYVTGRSSVDPDKVEAARKAGEELGKSMGKDFRNLSRKLRKK